MNYFKSSAWFELSGKRAAGIVLPVARSCGELRALHGKRVVIDGDAYRVTGVETYAMPNAADTNRFALTVEPDRPAVIRRRWLVASIAIAIWIGGIVAGSNAWFDGQREASALPFICSLAAGVIALFVISKGKY